MKKLSILFLLVIFSQSLRSQTESRRLFLVGTEFAGMGLNERGKAPDYVNTYFSFMSFTPKIAYFINKNTLIGIQGGRSFYKTNYYPILPTVYNLGFLARYYLPFSMKRVEESRNKKIKINLEVTPYVEYNHLWTNLGRRDSGQRVNTGRKLDFQLINPNIGISFKIGKSFMVDFGYRLLFYDNNDGQKGFQYRGYGRKASIEYIIHQKKKSK